MTTFKDYISRRKGGCVLDIPVRNYVKFGKQVHLSEAFALKLVADKTTVPVLKVISAFVKIDITYIVMERIEGVALEEAWE
jgi:hypothetical protein